MPANGKRFWALVDKKTNKLSYEMRDYDEFCFAVPQIFYSRHDARIAKQSFQKVVKVNLEAENASLSR